MATDMHEATPTPTEAPRQRRWVPWLIAAAVVLIVTGVAVGAVAMRNDSNGTSAVGTQPLASIRQACAQWHNSYNGASTPPAAWCDDMVGWMNSRMANGQMMGSMMWSNPDQMRQTCHTWIATRADNATNAATWCDAMVDWMIRDHGNWSQGQGWMMNDSMMGR